MVIIANMQMERRKDGDYYCNYELDRGLLMESTPNSKCYSNNSSPLVLQRCSFSSGGGRSSVGGSGSGGLGYIEHTVSKFDTLAGVAIKYGVEVADIKRMNGLTTDQQMFALKSLQIPLPGRHPPSPIILYGPTNSETPPATVKHSDSFNPMKSLKLSSSSSSSSIQNNYNLNPNSDTFEEASKPPLGTHRKSKSLFVNNNGLSEKLVRRRKSEVDLNNHSPEMAPKQDNSSSGAKKRLGLENIFPLGLMAETLNRVRKSSSTPSFQDSSSSSSIWPTSMLNLTADLQAAITLPIFEGLPNPIATPKKD